MDEEFDYGREKEHLIIGSGADCLITMGEEVFNESYEKFDINKIPSAAVCSIIRTAQEYMKEGGADLDMYTSSFNRNWLESPTVREALYNAINTVGYAMNRDKKSWQGDLRYLNVINDNGAKYWDALINMKGKQELSPDEYDTIKKIVSSLANNNPTRQYFDGGDDVEILYQTPVYFVYEGVPCKALIDMIAIDHSNKRIYVIDIKTTSEDTVNFHKAFKRYRYDIQAAFYMEAIRATKNQRLKDYTIEPFRFLVETSVKGQQGCPMVYICDDNVITKGKWGFEGEVAIMDFSPHKTYPAVGRKVEDMGFHDMVSLYKWYQEHGYDKHRSYVELNGIKVLTLNDIIQ